MNHTELKRRELVLMYALLSIAEKFSANSMMNKDLEHAFVYQRFNYFNQSRYNIQMSLERVLALPFLISLGSPYKKQLIDFWSELVPINKTFFVKDLQSVTERGNQFKSIFHFEFEKKYLMIREDFILYAHSELSFPEMARFLGVVDIDSELEKIIYYIDCSIAELQEKKRMKYLVLNPRYYQQWFPNVENSCNGYQKFFYEGTSEFASVVKKDFPQKLFGYIRHSLTDEHYLKRAQV